MRCDPSRLRFTVLLLLSLAAIAVEPDLDLGARVQPLPAANRFAEPGFHVWCGSPLRTRDGRYHLYYSRWPSARSFHPGWALCSEVAYAVADRPQGPYHHVNIALPARGPSFWDGSVTHNPVVLQVGERFALFYTGNVGDGQHYPTHRNHQRVGVALADRPEGPWTRLDRPIIDVSADPSAFDALCTTNPAVTMRPDGGLLLHYKGVAQKPGVELGGRVRYGAALADRPEGPWTKVQGRIFAPENPQDDRHWMLAEDSFVWYSAAYGHRYYAVARDVEGLFCGAKGGIALFQSADGLDWKAAAHPRVLGATYALEGGGDSGFRVERPMVLSEDGEPRFLFAAADGYGKNPQRPESSNIQIPLVPPSSDAAP